MTRILYVAESDSGGIFTYACRQALALAERGAEITFLCRPAKFTVSHPLISFKTEFPSRPGNKGRRLKRLTTYVLDSRKCMTSVVKEANTGYELILWDCFREYLSPFWIGPLEKLRKRGLRIGVINHDPVRDFIVGPRWWHEYCIRRAFRCFTDVFLHDDRRVDWGGGRPRHVRVNTIPHGPYTYPEGRKGREARRKEWNFSKGDFAFLSFGQVRDGKQLDLVLQAMTRLPGRVKLVVAGKGGAQSQKPVSYYQDLARELGVSARCYWENRYIDDDEVSDLFLASDAVLTTYSSRFVSASGVLSTAVAYNRPVLASAGDGPMRTALCDYPIGEWVEPGNPEQLLGKMEMLANARKMYRFEEYNRDHSWDTNARIILESTKTESSDCP